MPCAERLRQWETLVVRSAFDPPAWRRLHHLVAGLGTPAGSIDDAELAAVVRELFVLRPAARAARRRAIVSDQRLPWSDISPDLRSLTPDLFEAIVLRQRSGDDSPRELRTPPPWPQLARPAAESDWRVSASALVALGLFFGVIWSLPPAKDKPEPPVPPAEVEVMNPAAAEHGVRRRAVEAEMRRRYGVDYLNGTDHPRRLREWQELMEAAIKDTP